MLRFVKKIWYNKRIRICVIFMLVLLCLLIVFSWGLYRKLHRNRLYPVEQLSTPEQQLSAITGTVFGLLALLGVVNDPTTTGVSDSSQALTYQKPKKNYVELTKK